MSKLRDLLVAGGTFLRRMPCKTMFFLTFACLVIKEQFPFSNFPMYSSFGESTYYVYLGDGTGRPLATLPSVSMTIPTLKKIYQIELNKEKKRLHVSLRELSVAQKKLAGERVLAQLRRSRQNRLPPVMRLYEVNLSLRAGRFEKQSQLIAEAR